MQTAAAQALDARLRSLAAEERSGLVLFLRHLDLLDREQGYAELNCGSAFDYLVRKLHLPEGTAWRRVNAMRLLRRFPVLAAPLEDGRLNTTQLGVLAPVLTGENIEELIQRATHLTKEKTKELAVSIRPKEFPADGLRRLPAPAPRPVAVPAALAPDAPDGPSPVMVLGTPEATAQVALVTPVSAVSAAEAPTPRRPERSRIEPVASGWWQWRVGLDQRRKEKLDRLRGYLAHKVPDGDLGKILDVMLDDGLEKHGKRLGYVEPERPRKPAPPRPPTPGKRAPISREDRRKVLKRDGYRCTWTGTDGERCPCTTGLEMDHLDPAAETGSSRVADLTTRCRVHNSYRATLRYGAEYVRRRIEESRQARAARRAMKAATVREQVAQWRTGHAKAMAAGA